MKISERGQITIPKQFRDRLGLLKDVEVEMVPQKDGLLIKKSTLGKHPVDLVRGILKRPSNTDQYIEEVRGR